MLEEYTDSFGVTWKFAYCSLTKAVIMRTAYTLGLESILCHSIMVSDRKVSVSYGYSPAVDAVEVACRLWREKQPGTDQNGGE